LKGKVGRDKEIDEKRGRKRGRKEDG